ncbi:MAG: DUF370 domain-containing protein [Oscillospiraceae bacterium]|nr:DUF370 domain-containing protein [Oscillospiraceae bacterium]
MYIDIATDFLIDEEDIIGIFDLDNTTAAGKHTINFLNEKQKEGKVTYLIKDIPKSFVVTKNGEVFVVELSSQILRKRLEIK